MKGEIFRNLDDVVASARGALDRSAQPEIFNRIEWFRRTFQHTPPPGDPLIFRARTDGSDCWLFLMTKKNVGVAMGSWYTLAFRPVFSGNPDEPTKLALLVAIARRLKKEVASLTLGPVPADDANLIKKAFDQARWIASAQEATVSWTIHTNGMSFADYWASRPGELRSTAKRKREKFGIATKIYTRFDGVAWDSYQQIYSASWKPEEGSAEFLRDTALTEGNAGTLRLGIATHGDMPIAAQMWTVENDKAIIHKLAHLDSASEMSPGTILTAAMFEHVLDHDSVALIDFGTGDDRYKRDWMDTRSVLMSISLNNPLSGKGLAGSLRDGARALVGRRANI